MPASPVSKRTPVISPRRTTGTVSAATSTMSATIMPSSSASRRTGVSSRRSKYPSCTSVTSDARARDAGDTEDDRRRQLERLVVETRATASVRFDSDPTFTK